MRMTPSSAAAATRLRGTPQVRECVADRNPVSRLAALLTAILVAATVSAAASAANLTWHGHTKRQAEVNILHATGVLKRWRVPVLNLRTNTIRSNTRVSCAGTGRPVQQRFKAFTCTISYRRVRVRLRYTAFHGNGFGVRRLPLHPKTG
jgi:hypothetical protein